MPTNYRLSIIGDTSRKAASLPAAPNWETAGLSPQGGGGRDAGGSRDTGVGRDTGGGRDTGAGKDVLVHTGTLQAINRAAPAGTGKDEFGAP